MLFVCCSGLCKKGADVCESLHVYDLSKMPFCQFILDYGACCLFNTSIRLFDGSNKLVQNLSPTDKLAGEDGRSMLITHLDKTKTTDIYYTILTRDAAPFHVSPGHLVTVSWRNAPLPVDIHKDPDGVGTERLMVPYNDRATLSIKVWSVRIVRPGKSADTRGIPHADEDAAQAAAVNFARANWGSEPIESSTQNR